MNDFEKVVQSESTRRAFIARMGAAGLGAAAMALLAGCGSGSGTSPIQGTSGLPGVFPTPTPTPTPTPVAVLDSVNFPGIVGRNYNEVVLNFALTLEILEADLYRQALNLASGRALATALDTTPPASGSLGSYVQKVSNGTISGTLAGPAFLYLVQYAYVEAAHRDFLRVVLGKLGAPVAQPNPGGYTTTLNTSSATLSDILGVILIAEEEGTRAYHGAAGFITDATLLTNAAAIYSTECRHSAAVNYVLGNDIGPAFRSGDKNITGAVGTNPIANNVFEYVRDPATVLNDVKGFFLAAGVV